MIVKLTADFTSHIFELVHFFKQIIIFSYSTSASLNTAFQVKKGILVHLLINFCYNKVMSNKLSHHQKLLFYIFLLIMGLFIFFTTTEPSFFWIATSEIAFCSYQIYRLFKNKN